MQPMVFVLIVEDESLLFMPLEAALKEGGYAVEIATGGEEAIGKLDAPGANYGALVTDVNLGRSKLTGWDVAKHARELSPLIPVVYMTGASAADWGANGVPNSVLIQKPFAPNQVVTAVSQLLNQTSTASPAAS
jgi:DNA-binding response OmpR family regulator